MGRNSSGCFGTRIATACPALPGRAAAEAVPGGVPAPKRQRWVFLGRVLPDLPIACEPSQITKQQNTAPMIRILTNSSVGHKLVHPGPFDRVKTMQGLAHLGQTR